MTETQPKPVTEARRSRPETCEDLSGVSIPTGQQIRAAASPPWTPLGGSTSYLQQLLPHSVVGLQPADCGWRAGWRGVLEGTDRAEKTFKIRETGSLFTPENSQNKMDELLTQVC